MVNLTPSPRGRIAGSKVPAGFLLHPFEVGVAGISIVIAVALLGTRISGTVDDQSLVVRVLQEPVVWVWGFFLGLGGLMTLIGIFTRSRRQWSVPTEFAGLSLMGSAWAVYAVTIGLSANAGGLVPTTTGFAMSLASIVRIYALVLAQRIVDGEAVRRNGKG